MLGTVLLSATGLAFLFNLAFIRFFYAKNGDRSLMIAISTSFLLASLIFLALPFVKSITMLYLVFGAIQICAGFASMSYPTALQGISPSHLRGRITSINFLMVMLIPSIGLPLIGLVSDQMFGAAPSQLATAVTLVAGPAALIASVLYYSCLRVGFIETLADVARQDRRSTS
jgi:MFS family permease